MSGRWTFRPARAGDGKAAFDVTVRAIRSFGNDHYSSAQIDGWMGERTPDFYEALIANGRMSIAERDGAVVGFVDAEPGELTRLFVLPQEAGYGLGGRLLHIGLETARVGHMGPIRVEATLNAESFYRRTASAGSVQGNSRTVSAGLASRLRSWSCDRA